MERNLGFMAIFLLSSLLVAAQDGYDTLLTWHFYAKYPEDPKNSYILVRKDIRYRDARGRTSMVKGFEYSQDNPNPYFFYQATYNYGANDSLLSIQVDEVPRGENKFKLKEFWQYTYKGNQLQEIKTTKYAHSYGEKLLNQRQSKDHSWGSTSDTSGWTATSATRFSYDDKGRLTKKGIYIDYADRHPETMWLYTYGNELPDINLYYDKAYTLRMVYNHLYKNDRLVTYREEKLAGGIEIETYSYSYNKEGNLVELVISHSKMDSKNLFGPYKKDGKEDVSHRTEYKYKNGRLASKEVHYKDSYTKYKVKFIDRIGNMPSVSTSTTGYGDYQRTTTTVTSSTQPPPSKEDMIAKTKYKWKKYTVEYEYLPDGRQIVKGSTPGNSDGRFDSKGRLKVNSYCEPKNLYDGRPTCVMWEYKYRD